MIPLAWKVCQDMAPNRLFDPKIKCFNYPLAPKVMMYQARNWRKFPGGAKHACAITLEGQKPYFVMEISGLLILLGVYNHAKVFILGYCPHPCPLAGTCLWCMEFLPLQHNTSNYGQVCRTNFNVLYVGGVGPLIPPGVAPGIFRREADSSDEGAKIWFLGYYKCQKSPKKSPFSFQRGASMLRRGV